MIHPQDKDKYLLPTQKDVEILEKIYDLEEKNLSPKDKELVSLAKTQLEKDWRTPLLDFLNKLLGKYV